MMKSICALVHRPGSSRAAFQAYYEDSHAPLGIRHFPFARYVRNHLVDSDDVGFDTISEFWAKDIAATAGLMNGPVGDIMRADEARFMDQSRIAPAGAQEHVLSEGAPADREGRRTAILINPAAAGEGWREAVLAWGRALATNLPGVSVDFATAWGKPAFPAAAMLWLPGAPKTGAAPAALDTRRLSVRRVETPAELLLGA